MKNSVKDAENAIELYKQIVEMARKEAGDAGTGDELYSYLDTSAP